MFLTHSQCPWKLSFPWKVKKTHNTTCMPNTCSSMPTPAHSYKCPCLGMSVHMCVHTHAYPHTCMPLHMHAQACPHMWTTCTPMLVRHILLCFWCWEVMVLFWYRVPHWWALSEVRGVLSSLIFSSVFQHVCVALWSLSEHWHELIVPATLCFSDSLKFPT